MAERLPDLLIVGGGVIGLGLADSAARQGLSVTVLERERAGARSSWAGAGMLNCRPWPRAREGQTDYHDLVQASLRLYEPWAARLLEETEIDIGFRRCGALELFPAESLAQDGQAAVERLVAGCHARGVRAERLPLPQAQALEPRLDLGRIAAAVHLPDDAQVRNPRLLKALVVSCRQQGVHLKEGVDVADVWIEDGRARGALARDGARLAGGQVVVCAGAWTSTFPSLIQAAPRTAKIEPVRGQMLCYQLPSPLCTRLLTLEHQYLVPRPDGVLLAGSTMERVGYQALTTPEGQAGLQHFAESLLPALKGLSPPQGWADLRPGLKGAHPLLGPVPGVAGLFVAAGHFRNGILLAPITAEILAAQLRGQPPPLPVSPWLLPPARSGRARAGAA